jgi:NCS1 family nucleobase:cation symporter-1
LPKLLFDLGATEDNWAWIGNYSWFLGCGLGFLAFWQLERRNPMVLDTSLVSDEVSDGAHAV